MAADEEPKPLFAYLVADQALGTAPVLMTDDPERLDSLREAAQEVADTFGVSMDLVQYSVERRFDPVNPMTPDLGPPQMPPAPASYHSIIDDSFMLGEPTELALMDDVAVLGGLIDGKPGLVLLFNQNDVLLPPIAITGQTASHMVRLVTDALNAARQTQN